MVYDNLKAVVEAIFIGKERLFNRRFMALANHYRRFSSLRSINRHNRRTGSGRRLCTLTNDKQYKPCGQRHARATSGQNHGHAPKNLDFHSGRPCRLWLFRRQLRQTGI
jgi:hypothetical protein